MESITKATIRLTELKKGQHAQIQHHDESDFQLTLLEMGCVPGEAVRIEMVAPMGDPIAILVAGYCLSIRKADAQSIWVTPVDATNS